MEPSGRVRIQVMNSSSSSLERLPSPAVDAMSLLFVFVNSVISSPSRNRTTRSVCGVVSIQSAKSHSLLSEFLVKSVRKSILPSTVDVVRAWKARM